MNCDQATNLLEDFIDGNLPVADLKAVAEHQQSCSTCESNYRKAVQIRELLKETPVPPYSEGFVDRVLDRAKKESHVHKSNLITAFGGAIAAGVAIWFIVASTLFSIPTDTPIKTDDIYKVLVTNEVRTIKVAITSEHDIADVKMSVELSPNLEIAGYGKRKSINWDTRLKKGVNVIKLPIVGLAAGDGAITTRVQMNGKEKIMRIQTNFQTPGNVWHPINSAKNS